MEMAKILISFLLNSTPKPLAHPTVLGAAEIKVGSCQQDEVLQTPVTPVSAEALTLLHNIIKQDTYTLDKTSIQRVQRHVQKLANAAQTSLAKFALLHDQNNILTRMNNEAKVRRSTRSVVLGKAKVMSYEDIEDARAKRTTKDAAKDKRKRGRKRKSNVLDADEPEPEPQPEPESEPKPESEVVRAAKEDSRKRGRKRKTAAQEADQPEPEVARTISALEPEPESSQIISAPEPWRAPVARMI